MRSISLRFPILLIVSLIMMVSIWATQINKYDDDFGDYDDVDCFITCVSKTSTLPY